MGLTPKYQTIPKHSSLLCLASRGHFTPKDIQIKLECLSLDNFFDFSSLFLKKVSMGLTPKYQASLKDTPGINTLAYHDSLSEAVIHQRHTK
jgi:hypothetical protein